MARHRRVRTTREPFRGRRHDKEMCRDRHSSDRKKKSIGGNFSLFYQNRTAFEASTASLGNCLFSVLQSEKNTGSHPGASKAPIMNWRTMWMGLSRRRWLAFMFVHRLHTEVTKLSACRRFGNKIFCISIAAISSFGDIGWHRFGESALGVETWPCIGT